SADQILLPCELDDPPAHVAVTIFDDVNDVVQRDPEGEEPIRIDVDLVLLDETTYSSDLGHARHGLQPVADVPVVEGTHLGEVVTPAPIHEGVLEGPADSGRVGTQDGGDALRELSPDLIHVLEDAGPAPR